MITPHHSEPHTLLGPRHPVHPAFEQLEQAQQVHLSFVKNHNPLHFGFPSQLGHQVIGNKVQIWRRTDNSDAVGFCFVLLFIAVPCGTGPGKSQRFLHANTPRPCGMAVIQLRSSHWLTGALARERSHGQPTHSGGKPPHSMRFALAGHTAWRAAFGVRRLAGALA